MVESVKTTAKPASAPVRASVEPSADFPEEGSVEALMEPPAEGPVEAPMVFTKMKNVSDKILQLACGEVPPGKEVAFNAAEFSTLHMFLKGVK